MSDDNVIPFRKYKCVEDQDPAHAKANQSRLREEHRKQEMAAARKALSERIRNLKPSIDQRERIARRLGTLCSELKNEIGLRGVIGPIFEAAGLGQKEDSSKRRRRYIIPPGEDGNPKMLSASLPEYERLAEGFARALRRDADAVVLEVLREFSNDARGSALPSNETSYSTVAIMLNEMCNAIARRHRLKDAFLKAANWGIGADSEGRWKPEIAIARFHPANLPMEIWIAKESGCPELRLMLPSVELHGASYWIPVRATLQGASLEAGEPQLTDPDYWDDNASTYGETEIFLRVAHTVHIGFAPDQSMSAAGVLWESVDVAPLIGDTPPFDFLSVDRGWYTFRSTLPDGTDEVNAFKIDERQIDERGREATLSALQDIVEGESAFRIRKITPSSLAEVFAKSDSTSEETNFDFERTVIWGGDWEDMILDDRVAQSHSPSRTVAAAIERNLAFAPLPERLDTLLEQKVVVFKSELDSYISEFAEPFLKVADTLLEQWRSESGEAESSQ